MKWMKYVCLGLLLFIAAPSLADTVVDTAAIAVDTAVASDTAAIVSAGTVNVVQFIVSVIFGVLLIYCFPLIKALNKLITKKTGVEVNTAIAEQEEAILAKGVAFAESKALALIIKNGARLSGNEKLNIAMTYISKFLKNVDHDKVAAKIAAMIANLKKDDAAA